ncbi:MAG: fumarylacetoacetate hydrolase family protein [Planctomycetota bacterium]|nr:fumarylacetoacetate hydrolase family protein [Planctomycetota bacterium]MDA1162321.1 fumarylacetoacetate hydrolase family protein [Planctomycetota bacterium]
MRLARVSPSTGEVAVVAVNDADVLRLDLTQVEKCHKLSDILHSKDPAGLARFLIDPNAAPIPIDDVRFLAPIDQQEVWAAGVTYKRSQIARMEESDSAASHYDKVYTADRPELFFKANAARVSGPGQVVRVRHDSNWSVPEPEFTLVISPQGHLVGYTIGNDMSARDIEGENPLYLPQAKVYNQCAGLGPCIQLAEGDLDKVATTIRLNIERAGKSVFKGETNLGQMAREFEDLIRWLTRENDIPNGAFMMTGTGIVPPDDFTLHDGDSVSIDIAGIGTLTNPVVKESYPE